jgi:hypothetical protein
MSSEIIVNGRTGVKPSKPEVSRIYKREDGTFFIRVDDPENPEFWLEISVSNKKMKEISKSAL